MAITIIPMRETYGADSSEILLRIVSDRRDPIANIANLDPYQIGLQNLGSSLDTNTNSFNHVGRATGPGPGLIFFQTTTMTTMTTVTTVTGKKSAKSLTN
ncbi:hypothetical protein JCM33374_g4353 [Metschnikowia sp. JCM 33374]|nr:hypothetical protein JCM33374_g4353 [Metschnikowia sp. JCM 33374]